MGDPKAPSSSESTASSLASYIQFLPSLLQVTADQSYPVAQSLQNTAKSIAPQQQDLENRLLAQYGPLLQATGNKLLDTQNQAGISQASKALSGSGGDLVRSADTLDRSINPEYYNTRAKTSSALDSLLGSINVNGLSGSERAEVERGLNQQDSARGLLNSPSQTATVSNAMSFGNALSAKRDQLARAIGTATSFLPTAQGPTNTFAVGTGQATNQQNPAMGQFLGQSGANAGGNQAFSSGNQYMQGIDQTGMNTANINANRRDTLDRITGAVGALPSD